MYLFDLHCDTITECKRTKQSLITNDLHIDIERGSELDGWVQIFAFWLSDDFKGDAAYDLFLSQRELLLFEIGKNPERLRLYKTGDVPKRHQCNAIMAIEGGQVLGGRLDRIQTLKDMQISYLTLTWNSDNEIASGVLGSGMGLTGFGRQAVEELQRCSILVDVSHLNVRGFSDVCECAVKPIIASHSNAREIHDNKRNLYDWQIEYLVKNKGLCGINLYPVFVNGGEDCSMAELHRHIEHILSLGGSDIIALGTDFDGASMPSELNSVEKLYRLYDYMLKWYDEALVSKLFYSNAKSFFDSNITLV